MDDLTIPFLGEPRWRWQYPFGSLVRAGRRRWRWAATGACPAPTRSRRSTSPSTAGCRPTTRTRSRTHEVFLPDERLDLPTALAALHDGLGLRQPPRRDTRGRSRSGKFADLAVIDRNLFEHPIGGDRVGHRGPDVRRRGAGLRRFRRLRGRDEGKDHDATDDTMALDGRRRRDDGGAPRAHRCRRSAVHGTAGGAVHCRAQRHQARDRDHGARSGSRTSAAASRAGRSASGTTDVAAVSAIRRSPTRSGNIRVVRAHENLPARDDVFRVPGDVSIRRGLRRRAGLQPTTYAVLTP